jgi:hypothetical protein
MEFAKLFKERLFSKKDYCFAVEKQQYLRKQPKERKV